MNSLEPVPLSDKIILENFVGDTLILSGDMPLLKCKYSSKSFLDFHLMKTDFQQITFHEF